MTNIVHVLYNLVLSLWIGGISIFTFLMTPVIFRSFERDMAGRIVGKLFPGYFIFMLVLSILALLLFLAARNAAVSWRTLSLVLIVLALVINLFVTFKLHPDIKQVKQEIHSFEELSPEDPLRKKFGKLHAVSAVLNLLLLADGVTLLILSTVIKR